MDTLLFGLLSALCVGVLALVAVTAQRLTGRVSLELELGGRPLAQARAAANTLREQLETLARVPDVTRASAGAQTLQGGVTRDVTTQPSHVTVPLNATAKVTGYTEAGEPFPVPQDNLPPGTEP